MHEDKIIVLVKIHTHEYQDNKIRIRGGKERTEGEKISMWDIFTSGGGTHLPEKNRPPDLIGLPRSLPA